jgi:plasmid replication initiation protein
VTRPTIKTVDQDVVLREDLNVAHLGLISIQRKIAPEYTSWKVAFERAGIASEVECNGTQKYGIPHGTDNDAYLALQELYIEQGCPEDGIFAFTMYRLLQMCGLDDSGPNRRMMRESLERLSATQYWISGAWRSHEDDDWVTVGFRLIEKLVFTRSRRDVDGAKAIAVTLPRELIRNIRNGYFKPVSTTLLRQLGQPARATYRVLDALRHDPVQFQARTVSLQISLMDLAQRCGIATDRPDKIRRTLDPIHVDLLRSGYLKEVQITGRGKRQLVTYQFGQAAVEADAALVELLVQMKVPLVAARKAALDHADNVRDGVAQAKAILARGYRPQNDVGFVLDVVRSYGNGKYSWPDAGNGVVVKPAKPASSVPSLPMPETPLSLEDHARTLAFLLKGDGIQREALLQLPVEVLSDLHGRVLGRGAEDRAQAVALLRTLLASR